MRPSLADEVEGRVTLSEEQIVEGTRADLLPVLATDRVGGFGAAFRFGLFARGEWYADAVYARFRHDQWEEMGSGGSHGADWAAPWSPPAHGWEGRVLYVMGSGGLDVEDDDGSDAELLVVYGFAAPEVASIEISGPTERRSVPITSRVGAFAALLVGRGEFVLTAQALDGRSLENESFSLHPYSA